MSTAQETSLDTAKGEDTKIYRFVAWLGRLTQSRNTGAYAVMRRALSESQPENYLPAAPYVEAFLGNHAPSPGLSYNREARVYYLLAGLYCLVHRADDKPPKIDFARYENFGWSVALQHREQFPQASETPTSLEQRFLALMQSDDEQLVYFLRQMVTQIKEQPINWVGLGEDLLKWDEKTHRRWIQSFYRHYRSSDKQPAEKGSDL